MGEWAIELDGSSSNVVIRTKALDVLGELVRSAVAPAHETTAVIVTDERVGALYGRQVRDALQIAGFAVLEHQVVPGDASKSLEAVGELYRHLARHTVPRDAVVVALGGGVVSDLAGFVAATWMRGVRFVVCPTTLESAVDACIGGKTAINLPQAKNLVGAFHQPILVVFDPVCLKTLDPRDVRAGLAESVKHALIASEDCLAWHESHADAILGLDDDVIVELINRNLRIKAGIVERDVRDEAGLRAVLNFGHTIGHAIEACCDYALRHGECVALGMTAACRVSRAMNLLDDTVVSRVEKVLQRFGLPTQLAKPIDADRIIAAIRHDKKIRGGVLRVVLLEGVGRPVVRDDVADGAIREAYESLYA